MKQFVLFLLVIGAVNLLFVTVQALVFRAARFHVEQIGLGIPPVFRRRVNGTELKIGPVPVLAYVQAPEWLKASRGTRVLAALAPWLMIACIPALLIGPTRALRQQLLLWPRLIEGALDGERAHALIGRFWHVLASDWIEAFSLGAAFMVAFNLSPTPGAAGYHVLFAVLGLRPEDRVGKIVSAITWVLWVLLFGSWLLKLASFLAR